MQICNALHFVNLPDFDGTIVGGCGQDILVLDVEGHIKDGFRVVRLRQEFKILFGEVINTNRAILECAHESFFAELSIV